MGAAARGSWRRGGGRGASSPLPPAVGGYRGWWLWPPQERPKPLGALSVGCWSEGVCAGSQGSLGARCGEGAGPAAEEAEEERREEEREGGREEEGRRSAASPGRREKRVRGPGSRPHLSGKMKKLTQSFFGGRSAAPKAGQIDQPPEGGGEERGPGNSRSAVRWSPQRALGAGEMDDRCLLPCVAGRRAGSGPLPLSLPGCLLPPAAGAPACPPALLAPSPRLLEEMAGPLGRGTWGAARCGDRGALRPVRAPPRAGLPRG